MRTQITAVVTMTLALTVLVAQSNQPQVLGEPNGITITIDRVSSTRFVNAELRDVLHMIAKSAAFEVKFAEDLPRAVMQRQVTLNLENANLAKAFTDVLSNANLSYTVVDQKTVLVTAKRD